jgi:hypothetical protein
MAKLTKAGLGRKKPVTDEVLIPADDAQALELDRARTELANNEQRLSLAVIGGDAEDIATSRTVLAASEAAVEAVRDQIRKTGVSITLVGVGRVRWDEILREHPPTDEQKEADKDKPEAERDTFDPKTFWPALLAATADSDLTADDWQKEVFGSKNWGPAELHILRERAKAVNAGSRILELGN